MDKQFDEIDRMLDQRLAEADRMIERGLGGEDQPGKGGGVGLSATRPLLIRANAAQSAALGISEATIRDFLPPE